MAQDETLDDGTLSPEQSMALIEAQRARVEQQTDVNVIVLYGIWGAAWFLGFGLWAVTDGDDPWLDLPRGVVGALFGAMIIGAMLVTTWHSIRVSRGLRGDEQVRGAMYGWTWMLSFAAMFAVMWALYSQDAPEPVLELLWPVLSCLLVGVMQMMGGAVWKDAYQFGIGVWILLCTGAGAFLGLPGFNIVMSLAGGGGFLLMAAWFVLRRRR